MLKAKLVLLLIITLTTTMCVDKKSAEYSRYLRDCVDPVTGENYSADICVESKFWGADEN